MKNNESNCRFTSGVLRYFVYVWIFLTSGLLGLDHLLAFAESTIQNDITQAVVWGFIVSLCLAYARMKHGRGDERIFDMKRDQYMGFAHMFAFYAAIMFAFFHISDVTTDDLMKDVVLTVFIGLFAACVHVLVLMKFRHGDRGCGR